MPIKNRLHGLAEHVEHLKRYKYANSQGFQVGVVRAAYRLLQHSLDIVPVDTGYLRSTAHVVVIGQGFRTIARVIYSAFYSIWVHERLDLAHGAAYNRKYAVEIAMGRKRPRRPQEQAKFIETPLRANRREYVNIVREDMKARGRVERISHARRVRRRPGG
jgi:hypothetical protein